MKLLILLVNCFFSLFYSVSAFSAVYNIRTGDLFEENLRERIIFAVPGDVLNLPPGHFYLDRSITIKTNHITLKGAGKNKTVLDFDNQKQGGESLLVKGNGIILEDFQIVNSPGDAIKAKLANNIIIRNLKVTWLNSDLATHGAYGIYPVQCDEVLVEGNDVSGASDAGIYIGQSKRVIIVNNSVSKNTVGISVENSVAVNVVGNEINNNAIGVLIAAVPGLSIINTISVKVQENNIENNNLNKFVTPGNLAAMLPDSIGIAIIASDQVVVSRNRLKNHQYSDILVANYNYLGLDNFSQYFEVFSNGVEIFDNHFISREKKYNNKLVSSPPYNIIWDGNIVEGRKGFFVGLQYGEPCVKEDKEIVALNINNKIKLNTDSSCIKEK